MELIFNELSAKYLTESDYDAKERMDLLFWLCKKGKQNGFSHLRVARGFENYLLKKDYKVIDWLNDRAVSPTLKSFFLSYRRFPYIDESDESAENTFIEKHFSLNEPDDLRFNGSDPEGLAVAYIYDTIAASFPANKVWQKVQIKLLDCENEQIVEVRHVSLPEHFEAHIDFIEANKEIILQETSLNPNEKIIHLRDDHGKNILSDFASKLVKSVYVVEVINSLPFNPREGNFIREIYPDGKIEIVLIWTDKGYGLIIQTTGRNYRETKRIGDILKEQFN